MHSIDLMNCTGLKVRRVTKECSSLEVSVDSYGVTPTGEYTKVSREEMVCLYGLPENTRKSLEWALPSTHDAQFDHVERLAERVAEVISDTHDLDVTDDNYGVAIACDLLGIDQDEVYAARRKAKEDVA